MNRLIAFVGLTAPLFHPSLATAATKVQIDFVEALAPRDTTSSERFQKDYEKAIDLGMSLLKSKLDRCGYELETKTEFYEASDALKAKEIASKLDSNGAWLIVGPRRSNHYLLLAQGASHTPTISLMASADDVAKLDASHSSLSPTNSDMARVAALEAKARLGRKATYLSIVSDDCTACVDFSKAFDQSASKLGLRNLGQLPVHGEAFALEPVREAVLKQNPSIVLLPNYSKVAARVMSIFNDLKKPPLFIGGDGWGDQRYGFVQSGVGIDNVKGITVRGFPPVDHALADFRLGKEAVSRKTDLLFTGPIIAILKIMDETADSLCRSRPKTRQEFLPAFSKSASTRLRAPWGVSVYELKSGETVFDHTVRAR